MDEAVYSVREYMENMSTGYRYLGEYDPSVSYARGDIISKADDVYVYTGMKFEPVETIFPIDNSVDRGEEVVKESNCKNCGGLINKYQRRCEYCGTWY